MGTLYALPARSHRATSTALRSGRRPWDRAIPWYRSRCVCGRETCRPTSGRWERCTPCRPGPTGPPRPRSDLAEDRGIARFRGIAVDAYAVAKLAAQHLVDGNVVRLAGQVPQGHLDRAQIG